MARELKKWNGRPYGVLPAGQWKGTHIYVAAYSVEDVRRLCGELGLQVPSRNEITIYWSKGWGRKMDGIPVERGVWVGGYYSGSGLPPVKVLPKEQK